MSKKLLQYYQSKMQTGGKVLPLYAEGDPVPSRYAPIPRASDIGGRSVINVPLSAEQMQKNAELKKRQQLAAYAAQQAQRQNSSIGSPSINPGMSRQAVMDRNRQYAAAQGKRFNENTGAVSPILSDNADRTMRRIQENIVEPMLEVEGLVSGASLVRKGIGSFGRFSNNIPVRGTESAIDNADAFLGELTGMLKPGKQAAIDKGNRWFSEWANHPVTRQKIQDRMEKEVGSLQRILNNTPEYKTDLRNVVEQSLDDTIKNYEHTLNYKPDSKQYPMGNQIAELFKKSNVHKGNVGVSYGHYFRPWSYSDDVLNNTIKANPRTGGSWISRNPLVSNRNRTSTTIHENSHQWVKENLVDHDEIMPALNEDIRKIDNEWNRLISEGKSEAEIKKILGREAVDYRYLSDPTEVHARIMELRKHYGLNPSQIVTPEMAAKFMGDVTAGKTPVDSRFAKVFDNEGSVANLFNKLWAVPGVVGAASMMDDREEGGPVYPVRSDKTSVRTPMVKMSSAEMNMQRLANYANQYAKRKQPVVQPRSSTPDPVRKEAYAWRRAEELLNKGLGYVDVMTDAMQLGNFIPLPVAQAVGKVGNMLGSAVDSFQMGMDTRKGDFGRAAINAASVALPYQMGKKGYRRDMWNAEPGSMADRIANIGSRNGDYIHLTAPAPLANNPVIQKGVNFNRGLLGTLGAETMYDSYEDGGAYDGPGPKSGERTPIYVDNQRHPRLRAYQDSLSLYNGSTRDLNKMYSSFDWIKPGPLLSTAQVKKVINKKNPSQEFSQGPSGRLQYGKFKLHKTKEGVSGTFSRQKTINNYLRDNYPIKPIGWRPQLMDGEKYDSNTLYDYTAEYKKPVQPVQYRKPQPPIPVVQQIAPQSIVAPAAAPIRQYTGDPVYSPGAGSGMPSALVGFRSQAGDTIFIQPEDYQRFAVPAYGKQYIDSQRKQFADGGFLTRSVICANCGHSWKSVEGGIDPMTCHKCGGTAKMKNGGQYGGLDRWFAEKWVDVKSGKPCGRQEGESRAYPACRPSRRVNSGTPKTSSEMSPAEKARFKREKTSSQRISYNHKRR